MRLELLKCFPRFSYERKEAFNDYVRAYVSKRKNINDYSHKALKEIKDRFMECGVCEIQLGLIVEDLHKLLGGVLNE